MNNAPKLTIKMIRVIATTTVGTTAVITARLLLGVVIDIAGKLNL